MPNRRSVALVTGASSGIGAAAARLLAGRGHAVVGVSRRGEAPAGVHAAPMDVDDDASVRAGIARVLAAHGRLDVVVNAAGFGLSGPVETTSLDDARGQLETNFWGTVRVTREALPALRASGNGLVVNVSSLAGVFAIPFQAYYTASKFALEGWSEALAYEVAPFGVHVTLVEPGNVRSGFTDGRREAGGAVREPYALAYGRAIEIMVADERDAVGPEVVARTIAGVVAARRPPRRVTSGSAGERSTVLLRRFLPARAFEWIGRKVMLGG
ncbi:MAG: short-chain dehydrogenase/reductase [Actinomycetes bacterium]|nr:MAG: short-chain dehydrogenase/reductase [Actinomycetes bacterium]